MQNPNTHSFDAHNSRTNNLNTAMLDSRNFSTHNPSTYIHSSFHQHLADATGPIDFPFTNDYIFRAALQKDAIILLRYNRHLKLYILSTVIRPSATWLAPERMLSGMKIVS